MQSTAFVQVTIYKQQTQLQKNPKGGNEDPNTEISSTMCEINNPLWMSTPCIHFQMFIDRSWIAKAEKEARKEIIFLYA